MDATKQAAMIKIHRFLRPLVRNWMALKGHFGDDVKVYFGLGAACDVCYDTTFGARHCANCRRQKAANHDAWCERNGLCAGCERPVDSYGRCEIDCSGEEAARAEWEYEQQQAYNWRGRCSDW